MLELKSKGKNFLRNLPELTDSENLELYTLLANPVVTKYFNLVMLTAAADLALTEATQAGNNPNALIVHQAYVKGIISVVDQILNLPTTTT